MRVEGADGVPEVGVVLGEHAVVELAAGEGEEDRLVGLEVEDYFCEKLFWEREKG